MSLIPGNRPRKELRVRRQQKAQGNLQLQWSPAERNVGKRCSASDWSHPSKCQAPGCCQHQQHNPPRYQSQCSTPLVCYLLPPLKLLFQRSHAWPQPLQFWRAWSARGDSAAPGCRASCCLHWQPSFPSSISLQDKLDIESTDLTYQTGTLLLGCQ